MPHNSDAAIARNAAQQLLAGAGDLESLTSTITIEPGAVAIPSQFRCAEAASAALAAGAAVAAEIWKLRSGQSQRVSVSLREAAASLTSFSFQSFHDADKQPPPRLAPEQRTHVAGFHLTRDGRRVYLHAGFPHNTASILKLLGNPEDAEAVRNAVAKWTGADLQDALGNAGLCGAMVHSPEEWDATEQGRVLAARPVVEITRIGDSDPEPFSANAQMPLDGIKVLDLTRVLAGPTNARTLAQYGADAMRIAHPDLPSVPFFVSDTGHGKRSAFLDLKSPHGVARLRELVLQSDVFAQGYRSGAMERMGLSTPALAALRPGLIYTTINCYGHEGAWRSRPGWEQLAQTVTGMAHIHGGADTPELQPCAVTDYTTGYLAAFGTLVALLNRARFGGSYLVRASLSQTGMWVRRLGLMPEAAKSDYSKLDGSETNSFCVTSDTPFGRLSHLRPSVQMSETPARWRLPAVPLGTHQPRWQD